MFPLVVDFIWPELDKNKKLTINYSNHLIYMIIFIFGMILFCFDLPQRFIPGKLDFLGTGHQIFHICAFSSNYLQIKACYIDYITNKNIIANSRSPSTFFSCITVFFSMLIFYVYVIKCFYRMIGHNFDNNGLEILKQDKNK